MATLHELIAQRKALDDQIAAQQREQKVEAVARIRTEMATFGVTVDDLGGRAAAPRVKRPPKYTDGKGNTWTGTGKRPTWLKQALLNGATLEQFEIKS